MILLGLKYCFIRKRNLLICLLNCITNTHSDKELLDNLPRWPTLARLSLVGTTGDPDLLLPLPVAGDDSSSSSYSSSSSSPLPMTTFLLLSSPRSIWVPLDCSPVVAPVSELVWDVVSSKGDTEPSSSHQSGSGGGLGGLGGTTSEGWDTGGGGCDEEATGAAEVEFVGDWRRTPQRLKLSTLSSCVERNGIMDNWGT